MINTIEESYDNTIYIYYPNFLIHYFIIFNRNKYCPNWDYNATVYLDFKMLIKLGIIIN